MITFHRLLIGTAIAFCLTISVWLFLTYRTGGEIRLLVLSVTFFVAAIALSYYLRNLDRFLRR